MADDRPGASKGSFGHPTSGLRLAPELQNFSRHPSGTLDDISAVRSDVAQALECARIKSVLRRDAAIRDVSTDAGLRLRLYRPAGAAVVPAIVYFHGGAFLLGSPELEDPGCVRYAVGAGCAVVSVDYRLAPEHRFPAGVEDCYAGLAWTVRHAAALGIDPARVGVGGSSAGGALAAAVALMARDRGGPALVYQMLIYPVLDDRLQTLSATTFTDTPVFARPAVAAMWRHYLGDDRPSVSPYAAPARATDLTHLPPAYIEACGLDPLRDEDVDYATRLLQAGVTTELHVVPGAPHGFDQFYLGAPGDLSWPIASTAAVAPGEAADAYQADLDAMPDITRRIVTGRIAALRAALHAGTPNQVLRDQRLATKA